MNSWPKQHQNKSILGSNQILNKFLSLLYALSWCSVPFVLEMATDLILSKSAPEGFLF